MHPFKPIFTLLKIDTPEQVTVLDAACLEGLHVPPFPPDAPALLGGFSTSAMVAYTVQVLLTVYPGDHPLSLAWKVGSAQARMETQALANLIIAPPGNLPEWLYLPPLAKSTSFESLQEVIAHLRAPDGCPWDREQTHQSLRSYLLEESFEALDALDANDPLAMQEEFGDLILQIVLHAQIAAENGEFRMAQILQSINAKLVRRHPHVFGEVQVDGVGHVLQNWEKLKAEERKEKGEGEKSLLDGIPKALPALVQAMEYQKRAARVGFDWPDAEGILDKICEEAAEVRSASNHDERAAEIGDLLFALVNLARFYHVDAESMLRETNARFLRRFGYIERSARQQARAVSDLTLQEMDALWEAAKLVERTR